MYRSLNWILNWKNKNNFITHAAREQNAYFIFILSRLSATPNSLRVRFRSVATNLRIFIFLSFVLFGCFSIVLLVDRSAECWMREIAQKAESEMLWIDDVEGHLEMLGTEQLFIWKQRITVCAIDTSIRMCSWSIGKSFQWSWFQWMMSDRVQLTKKFQLSFSSLFYFDSESDQLDLELRIIDRNSVYPLSSSPPIFRSLFKCSRHHQHRALMQCLHEMCSWWLQSRCDFVKSSL